MPSFNSDCVGKRKRVLGAVVADGAKGVRASGKRGLFNAFKHCPFFCLLFFRPTQIVEWAAARPLEWVLLYSADGGICNHERDL